MQDGDESQARLRQASAAKLGQPLDGASVDDLRLYITALQAEIMRVERTIAARQGVRSAADAVFKPRDP